MTGTIAINIDCEPSPEQGADAALTQAVIGGEADGDIIGGEGGELIGPEGAA